MFTCISLQFEPVLCHGKLKSLKIVFIVVIVFIVPSKVERICNMILCFLLNVTKHKASCDIIQEVGFDEY